MGKTILFKRGTVANLPDLQSGEPGWATDTKQLYVGDGEGTPVKVGSDVSDFMDDVVAAADLAATLTALGLDTSLATLALPDSTTISAFGKTLVDDADAAAAIATLGLDADIATLSVPASATISTFAKTFLDDTTAAAVRTTLDVQADLDFFRVDDYGAVGDGTTDDTAAIQSALTAGAGATVYFTKGKTYKVISNLSVPADTRLWGYGSGLSCATSNFNALDFVDGGGIYGMTLTGAGNSAYAAAGIAIQCKGTSNDPAAPTFVDAPVIIDCTITEWSAYGVFFEYVNKGLVENCDITEIGYAGVGGCSCNDTIVRNNRIVGVTPGTSGDAYGIFLDRQNGTSETADPRSYRCIIEGNNVRNVAAADGNNGQGIDTHGGMDFRIIGNTIDTCEVGIALVGSVIDGTQALGCYRCVVMGNTIKYSEAGDGVGYGIIVSGANDGGTPVQYASGIVIQGNTITGHGISNDQNSGGIFIQVTKGISITGNTIIKPRCNGIGINLCNYGMNISGNVIEDPHDDDFTTPTCIGVVGSTNSGFIGGNTCLYNTAAVDTYVNIYSVATKADLSGLDLDIYHNSYCAAVSGHNAYYKGTSTGVRDT